ncbi:MAG: hypothetical protein HRT88_22375, partial [Lentisphaeraceae bacterium]|nr:hypothetical protein [Lentisphaeraceae bacterium]
RFVSKILCAHAYKLEIKTIGFRWDSPLPGFFIHTPGSQRLKGKQRLLIRLSAMLVLFAIAGSMQILLAFNSNLPEMVQELLHPCSFYIYGYLIYHFCPLFNSDLYVACSDYLDEPFLRKSSFTFMKDHFRRFVNGHEEHDHEDHTIYVMFDAGVILWIAFVVQLIIVSMAQNIHLLGDLFRKEQSTTSIVLVCLLLIPAATGFLATVYWLYKSIIKTVVESKVLNRPKIIVINISVFAILIIIAMRFMKPESQRSSLLICATIAVIMATWHALKGVKLQKYSLFTLQLYSTTLISLLLTMLYVHYINHTNRSAFVLASTTAIVVWLLLYSLVCLKINWGEFIHDRRHAYGISALFTIVMIIVFLGHRSLMQNIYVNMAEFADINLTAKFRNYSLFLYLVWGLSLLLNLPSLVYRNGTKLFAPSIALIIGLHCAVLGCVLLLVYPNSTDLFELITAGSILLVVGVGTFNLTAKQHPSEITTYPIGKMVSEKHSLCEAFQYILRNCLHAVHADYGESGYTTIIRRFKRYAVKINWNAHLEEICTKEENVNTLGETYKIVFSEFHKILYRVCGKTYADKLLFDIEDHLHEHDKQIIYKHIGCLLEPAKQPVLETTSEELKYKAIQDVILFNNMSEESHVQLSSCLRTANYDTG